MQLRLFPPLSRGGPGLKACRRRSPFQFGGVLSSVIWVPFGWLQTLCKAAQEVLPANSAACLFLGILQYIQNSPS